MPVNRSFLTLDWTVRIVAAVIVVMAAIGIPVTYAVVSYHAEASRLAYRTELAARRIAEFAYVNGDAWKYQAHRIAELIAFYNEGERQRVRDAKGGVVAEHGPGAAEPKIHVSRPVMVQGREVGRIEVDDGIGHLYVRTAMLALLGLALAAGVFLCAHYIPLRALRRAIAEHETIEADLGAQIEKTHSALQEAQEATRAKSVFLATMSHEIRTPMNAVLGLLSALMDTALDGEQRHLVETISQSGHSLLRILNDILDVSKLDAGKVTLEMRPFSLAAVLDQTTSILGAKAVEKGIELRAVAAPGLPAVVIGDEIRLRQVLINLADNAIKFTDKGTVEIELSLRDATAQQATIDGHVRDSGVGIAADRVARLFDEFTQADSSINRKYGGTGLGLAICKRIIEQMGGVITVQSTPGIGTTFSFTISFPVADAAALAQHGKGSDRVDLTAVLAGLPRRLRVLLAEDNETNQLVFSHLVRPLGFDLTIAANGQEAVDFAAARVFDLVFMDMRMPVMDGLAAARAIRDLGGVWTEIPIIALTANAFPEDIKLCEEAGMSGFIAKPISKPVLLERVSMALKRHPLLENSAPAPPPPAPGVVFDQAAFAELVDAIGAEGAGAALKAFVDETAERLVRMRTLSCDRDRARIKDEAHSLKGSAGTLALIRLSDLARSIQRGAMTVSAEDYAAALDRLEAAYAAGRPQAERAFAEAAAVA